MLRVKVKSLAEEARIIRREERRTHGALQGELRFHRIGPLRKAARESHIAYALVKGRTLEQIEHPNSSPFDKDAVNKMLFRYGPRPLMKLE